MKARWLLTNKAGRRRGWRGQGRGDVSSHKNVFLTRKVKI